MSVSVCVCVCVCVCVGGWGCRERGYIDRVDYCSFSVPYYTRIPTKSMPSSYVFY